MIRAVVWDLGGVLCRFRPERRVAAIARASGAPANAVSAVLTPALLERLDTGGMRGDELLVHIRTELGWDCDSTELGQTWAAAFEPDEDVLALARQVGLPAAQLTNNGPPLSDHYAALLPDVADVVPLACFSGSTGRMKPGPDAFLSVCAALDAAPGDVLFVDDSQLNVDAASKVGLQVHRFIDAPTLQAYLHEPVLHFARARGDR